MIKNCSKCEAEIEAELDADTPEACDECSVAPVFFICYDPELLEDMMYSS